MALKPWYKVVTPREDLRDGRPLDASEFAVHLDHVRDNRAPADYQEPQRFFDRTFLTKNLIELASTAARRLSGIKVETSAVFNLTTQFGGGKTHALTLLYHSGVKLLGYVDTARATRSTEQVETDIQIWSHDYNIGNIFFWLRFTRTSLLLT